MPLSASEIVLEYVCPSLGVILANMMFSAPMRDLQRVVSEGNGLGDLNPTPWAFMLGNCLGWTAYGILISNWFVFWANYPGFLFACWLNLGAVKLMYSSHHRDEVRQSLVRYLSTMELSGEQRQSLVQDNDNDGDNNNDNDNEEALSSNNNDYDDHDHDEDWAKIVWEVTSQTTPAKTPHERLVMGMIVLWTVVLTVIGFHDYYTRSDDDIDNDNDNNDNDNDSNSFGQNVVGYVVNANLVFFYGAPLSSIFRVVKTRSSESLHVPTMVLNTCNATFWTAYALAVRDPFISVPNGLGVVLGATQLALWFVFPKRGSGNGSGSSGTAKADDGDGDDDGADTTSHILVPSASDGASDEQRNGIGGNAVSVAVSVSDC
eukprot:jgi/Psemu1/184926/e_gw1.43.197.1